MSKLNRILMMGLPPAHDEMKGYWYKGYPIHHGSSKESVNYATVYAYKNKIIPDQSIVKRDWDHFVLTLKEIGFDLTVLPFPSELNQPKTMCHDAVMLRDVGLMFKNIWIKARFSAKARKSEAEACAKLISDHFGIEVIDLPHRANLEFGDLIFVRCKNGSFYLGGLSRSTNAGHAFVKELIQPDVFLMVKSEGYHLDTIISPLINSNNELCAFVVASPSIEVESLTKIKDLGFPIFEINAMDSSGTGESLGNYAVNALVGPGFMVTCHPFETTGVEEKIKELGITHHITPLTYFRYAGGSCHCLTNEIYE